MALLGQPKIADSNLILLVEEDVLSFQISMQNALFMEGEDAKADLNDDLNDFFFLNGAIRTSFAAQ